MEIHDTDFDSNFVLSAPLFGTKVSFSVDGQCKKNNLWVKLYAKFLMAITLGSRIWKGGDEKEVNVEGDNHKGMNLLLNKNQTHILI